MEYDTLNAADFGVPQTRKRLVLHGIRKDVHERIILNSNNSSIKLLRRKPSCSAKQINCFEFHKCYHSRSTLYIASNNVSIPSLFGSGGKREDQEISAYREYLQYYMSSVFYLPNKSIPEKIKILPISTNFLIFSFASASSINISRNFNAICFFDTFFHKIQGHKKN